MTAATFRARAATASAQTPDSPTAALLSEVHALRIAMEQSASVAPRVQLTLVRLNIEEQRVAQLTTQLDQIRRELTTTRLEAQKLGDQVPDVEKGLQTSSDDKSRRGYEYEQVSLKQRLRALSRLEEQLRTREDEALQALTTEQARWTDLNSRLDELERLLGPIPR
jgi:DNA repair exonuclease SbcCD ATPase subunit